MKTVPLSGIKAAGRVALVDDEDYDLVMQHRWSVFEKAASDRRRTEGPYAAATVPDDRGRSGRRLLMHKLLTGWPETDHINHDTLDNQRHNLRVGSGGVNAHNTRPRIVAASRFKGVCWEKNKRLWRARIRVDDRSRSLGYFKVEEEAAEAYDAAAREMFGEHAYLNFPQAC